MNYISCNFHIDETVGFFIDELVLDGDSYVLKIGETELSYPDVTIFLSLSALHRLRDALDKYFSTLPAEGEVDSERKEAVQTAEDSQLEP
ncbi:MAG: hypothetical protein ABIG68_02085 [Acidobacteriota bacterium]